MINGELKHNEGDIHFESTKRAENFVSLIRRIQSGNDEFCSNLQLLATPSRLKKKLLKKQIFLFKFLHYFSLFAK